MATELTSKKYINNSGSPLKGEIQNFGNVKWTEQNADFLLGEAFSDQGYARIKTVDKDLYTIISARDIRYTSNVVSYSATKTTNDEMMPANSADWVELTYKSENGFNRVSSIARNLRPFMSRYGRVIDDRSSSTIIVRDNLANVYQLLPLIRKMDASLSKAEITKLEKDDRMEILREKTRAEISAKFEEMRKGWEKEREKLAPAPKK